MVTQLPLDSTFNFWREGYLFGQNRFERFDTDALRARLLGHPITILRGVEAARFFYEGDRFTRTGALPTSVVHSLQDEGSVQTLDAEDHRRRKERFTSVLDERGNEGLVEAFDSQWRGAQRRWTGNTIEFLPEINAVLLDAVLAWLGIEETRQTRARLTREVAAMIDGAGSFGPRNWWGRYLRQFTEEWAVRAVREARAHSNRLVNALVHDLDDDVAAVELLNIVRPVVAVGRFMAFAALALHDGPAWRSHLARQPGRAHEFAQEVRRLSPFFPVIAGLTREETEFDGMCFSRGDWVMVDLFATNHHPRYWRDPWVFDPSRFTREPEEQIVAQGAGEIATTHRCPGEPATVALLVRAVQLLAGVYWSMPEQALHTGLDRFPAAPGGRLLLSF